MKILVTGAQGMLGQDLVPLLREYGHTVVGTGHAELDVTDGASVRAALELHRPELVIQSAAYTNVDGCESNRLDAFRVNGLGTRLLAIGCQQLGAPLMYLSTDYVFDGTGDRPYIEIDRTNPQSVYGQSKLAGEQAVQELLNQFFIVRTSWLYGRGGKNFVDTMRTLGREKPELAVVGDQHGSPTWTVALSHALARLIERGIYGTYHVTGQGATTWHDFTRAILAAEGIATPVRPITTAELGRPAPRPAYSVLENLNLQLAGVPLLPSWQESLETYLAQTRAVVR
ncbi:MAG: dTDP-4-dehydrorhamnose reductase [Cyanobacteria bacterium RYN_339]|nr:dTDP-4-dehydrorhamnose reductase [Cyanobacteria bacterium RYN_339]